ncbi:MAG: M48 family metallopeptidase, partial [Spirochaetes bacterium]|nr:M48 family metallopeptidase [Spirochaetota bacterium]
AVPAEVIQYILFHEGLHRKLGKDHREGGRRFHSRTFRTLERTFPDWRKWEAFLRQDWPKIARSY